MSVIFDLTTIGLSNGTYNITAIAKAGGYADSAESEAVTYIEQDELRGTWQLNSTVSRMSYGYAIEVNCTMSSDGYSLSLPFTSALGNYTYNKIGFSTNTTSWFLRFGVYGSGSAVQDGKAFAYLPAGYSSTITKDGWYYDTSEYYTEWVAVSPPTLVIDDNLAKVTNGAELLTWLKANATKVS